jgi:medium-chain acyl-[acyl-carrier-protein] hydrolase
MKGLGLPEHQLTARFLRRASSSVALARVFCFPFAGGSAAVFAAWADELNSAGIDVWSAQPRGRGMRLNEPLHQSVKEMAGDYIQVIRAHQGLPFAFYGHSLGGLLAFELALQLEAEGLVPPTHLFIGASAPPALGLLHPRIAHLPDEGFMSAIRERYSGIPDAVLREPELMALFLPGLRADFAAHETFDRSHLKQVHCPITVFAGSHDPMIEPTQMQEWERHTAAEFDLRIVPGDHFFLTASRDSVLSTVREKMWNAPAAAPAFLMRSGFAES